MKYIYQIAMHLGCKFKKWIRSETWEEGEFMYTFSRYIIIFGVGFGLLWIVIIFMNSTINN